MGAYRFYRSYLDAHQAHTWIKEIWDYVQNDPQYKDKTALVLPTDHGHGDTVKAEWTSHGNKFEGSSEYILRLWDQKIEGKEK
jgi:hypothetical protein